MEDSDLVYKKLKEARREVRDAEAMAVTHQALVEINKKYYEFLSGAGTKFTVNLPSGDVVDFETAIERSRDAFKLHRIASHLIEVWEEQLRADPDDRNLVNAKKMKVGTDVYESCPPQVRVTYLDEVKDTKVTELWSIPRVIEWHREKNLRLPGVCKTYLKELEEEEEERKKKNKARK
tara:strand:- start:2465 stop:2998 length:534 start_codon:yes stop_codon:yes gene_type:complete